MIILIFHFILLQIVVIQCMNNNRTTLVIKEQDVTIFKDNLHNALVTSTDNTLIHKRKTPAFDNVILYCLSNSCGIVEQTLYESHYLPAKGYLRENVFNGNTLHFHNNNVSFFYKWNSNNTENVFGIPAKTWSKVELFNDTFCKEQVTLENKGHSLVLHANVVNYDGFKQKLLLDTFYRIKGKGLTCLLLVVLDESFIRIIHQADTASAIAQAQLTIQEADSVFRSTDIDEDGMADNIGFAIRDIVIFSAKNKSRFYPYYSDEKIDATKFISHFSRYPNLGNYCLGIAFTAQQFFNSVIGVSFTADIYGGVCDRPFVVSDGPFHLNSIVITARTRDGRKQPQIMLENTLVHELGHSFGCRHDESDDCKGYIMSPKTFHDYSERKHFVFSSCCKRNMLWTMVRRNGCFEMVTDPYCGNGIIEDGEDCDCGMSLDCLKYDPCCTPRIHKTPCKANKLVHECHPSQGPCCSLDCRYADLENIGLDCKNFEQECSCENQTVTQCKCGVNSVCSGSVCTNIECSRINLTECTNNMANNHTGCQTCCNYNGICMLAVEASRKVIASLNKSNFQMVLGRFGWQNEHKKNAKVGHYEFYESFCRYNRCLSLAFRKVKNGDYCLINGKIGICQLKVGECRPYKAMKIYPNFEANTCGVTARLFVCSFLCSLTFILYSISNIL